MSTMGTDDKRYTVRHPRNEAISKNLRCRTPIYLLCLFNFYFRAVAGIMSSTARLTTRGIWSHTPVLGLSASTGLGRGNSLPPLSSPLIELITPDSCSSSADVSKLVHSVKKALDGGVKLVQLRDRRSHGQSIAKLACILRDSTRERAWFVINGDPKAARAWGADGVHLPEHMMDRLASLRDSGEWPRVVGCSVHSAEAAVNAARLGVDYVQVGTMFTTPSHPGKEPEGVGLLSDVRRRLDAHGLGGVLVIGVGGINRSNCGMVAAAGGDGVAAIRCLCDGEDPEGQARGMLDAFLAGSGDGY